MKTLTLSRVGKKTQKSVTDLLNLISASTLQWCRNYLPARHLLMDELKNVATSSTSDL